MEAWQKAAEPRGREVGARASQSIWAVKDKVLAKREPQGSK